VSKVGSTVAEGASPGRELAEAPPDGPSGFAGFPPGAQATPIPSLFFTRLLPRLTDPIELGLATYVFYLLHRKKSYPRFFTADDLAAERDLALFLERTCDASTEGPVEKGSRSVTLSETKSPRKPDSSSAAGGLRMTDRASGGGRRAALERGLAALVGIGLLLAVPAEGPDGVQDIYFLNTASDRRAAERLRRGELTVAPWRPLPEAEPVEPSRSIYALYEQNIGPLTPLVADQLQEAEELYPQEWLRPAFERAATLNKRNWRYVAAILRRWAAEGPDYAQAGRDTEARVRRPGQFSGKYRDLVRR
jgi:DNA replication protein